MKVVSKRRLGWAAGISILFLIIFAGFSAAVDANMTSEQCLGCHGQVSSKIFVYQQELQQSVHGAISCDGCHAKMNTFPHEGKASDAMQMCVTCHSNISKEFGSSVHNKAGLDCTSCHGRSHAIVSGSDQDSPVAPLNVVKTCSKCHEGQVVESYLHSFHGIANKFGSTATAQCVSCHGSHNILGPDDPASLVAKENVPANCAKCHGEEPLPNFAEGTEHAVKEPGGPGAPMYYTLKFFTWLTIITISLLIIHIELELFRKLRNK